MTVLGALSLLAAADVELGRRAEGGRVTGQRPHKGLSAWPFAAVLLCTSPAAALVTLPVYACALRVPLFKWVGSGAIVTIAAAACHPLLPSLVDPGPAVVLELLAAATVFLAVDAVLFAGCAAAGEPSDEQWLRDQLRSRAFYTVEFLVLCQATVAAVLWVATPRPRPALDRQPPGRERQRHLRRPRYGEHAGVPGTNRETSAVGFSTASVTPPTPAVTTPAPVVPVPRQQRKQPGRGRGGLEQQRPRPGQPALLGWQLLQRREEHSAVDEPLGDVVLARHRA